MTTPVFPPELADIQDSKTYTEEHEDPSLQTDLEGGYQISRAKHTRTPRKTWTSGLTHITTEEKALLIAFWQEVKGGSVIFEWINPEDLVTYQVRFKGPLKIVYSGRLDYRRWDIQFTVMQA